MKGTPNAPKSPKRSAAAPPARLHPSWRIFVDYCADLRYGEIECLKIQDGLPVLAEVVKRKVKFEP